MPHSFYKFLTNIYIHKIKIGSEICSLFAVNMTLNFPFFLGQSSPNVNISVIVIRATSDILSYQ